MEMIGKVEFLKLNLEYLVGCLNQLESITNSKSLLTKRALNIIENPIFFYLQDKKDEDLKWVVESVNTFLRYYPDNIYQSNFRLLDKELNRQFSFINEIVIAITC